MIFGTFDILHKGHLNFFKQARKLAKNPYLIVSVARDINVKKIKGNKPVSNEKVRLGRIKACNLVDKSVLGGVKSYIPHILKEKPDIIALGYDQRAYVKNLKELLKSKGLKVILKRLISHKPKVYKTSLLRK
jgi:FAD synthetase